MIDGAGVGGAFWLTTCQIRGTIGGRASLHVTGPAGSWATGWPLPIIHLLPFSFSSIQCNANSIQCFSSIQCSRIFNLKKWPCRSVMFFSLT